MQLPTQESLYWEAVQSAYMRYCQNPSGDNRRIYHEVHSQWAGVFNAYCNGEIRLVEVN